MTEQSKAEKLQEYWLLDAYFNHPVKKRAWAELVAALREAAYRETNGPHDGRLPDGLEAVMSAILALHHFIAAHDFMRDEKLGAITFRAMTAIMDIASGIETPLFTPVRASKTRKRTVPTFVSVLAARAVDELVASGTPLKEALAATSRAVKAGKLAAHEKCSPATIQNYRARLHQGEDAVSPEALVRYRMPLLDEAGVTPQSRAEWLLKQLRTSNALRYG